MPLTYEKDAAREQVWLRAFLMGPTGSGKSLGALRFADQIFDGRLKVTLINTERGRGKMYADRFKFDYIDLSEDGDFSPESYTKALDLAEEHNPGGVIIIDSASHEWMGQNGILSQADRFGDWKVVRPKHNAWVERLMALNAHVIVTVRAKMKYEVGEEETGGRKRQIIKMLGVGPIQSDDLQYEFNLVGRFEQDTHDVAWTGHIAEGLPELVMNFGVAEQSSAFTEAVTTWLAKGNPLPEPPKAATDKQVVDLAKSLHDEGFTDEQIDANLARIRKMPEHMGVLPEAWAKEQTKKSRERVKAKKAEAEQKANPSGDAEPEAASNDVAKGEGGAQEPSAEPETAEDKSPAEATDAAQEPVEGPARPESAEPEMSDAEADRLWGETGGATA